MDQKKRREGIFDNIIRESSIEDTSAFKEMTRMSHEEFLPILRSIEKDITPNQVLGGHKVIFLKARLAVTIRFLASGETFRSLSFQFQMLKGAISYIVTDVCNAIIKNLSPVYLKTPSSAEEWLEISAEFEERWQFPNCIGALDGKHVVMQPPPEAGSHFSTTSIPIRLFFLLLLVLITNLYMLMSVQMEESLMKVYGANAVRQKL